MTTKLSDLQQAIDNVAEFEFDNSGQVWGLDEVLAAARRFLALTETGQRIFWCEEHQSNLRVTIEDASWGKCIYREELEFNEWVDQSKVADCRIVPKFLADYLIEDAE